VDKRFFVNRISSGIPFLIHSSGLLLLLCHMERIILDINTTLTSVLGKAAFTREVMLVMDCAADGTVVPKLATIIAVLA
jgi:hypothetical protein